MVKICGVGHYCDWSSIVGWEEEVIGLRPREARSVERIDSRPRLLAEGQRPEELESATFVAEFFATDTVRTYYRHVFESDGAYAIHAFTKESDLGGWVGRVHGWLDRSQLLEIQPGALD